MNILIFILLFFPKDIETYTFSHEPNKIKIFKEKTDKHKIKLYKTMKNCADVCENIKPCRYKNIRKLKNTNSLGKKRFIVQILFDTESKHCLFQWGPIIHVFYSKYPLSVNKKLISELNKDFSFFKIDLNYFFDARKLKDPNFVVNNVILFWKGSFYVFIDSVPRKIELKSKCIALNYLNKVERCVYINKCEDYKGPCFRKSNSFSFSETVLNKIIHFCYQKRSCDKDKNFYKIKPEIEDFQKILPNSVKRGNLNEFEDFYDSEINQKAFQAKIEKGLKFNQYQLNVVENMQRKNQKHLEKTKHKINAVKNIQRKNQKHLEKTKHKINAVENMRRKNQKHLEKTKYKDRDAKIDQKANYPRKSKIKIRKYRPYVKNIRKGLEKNTKANNKLSYKYFRSSKHKNCYEKYTDKKVKKIKSHNLKSFSKNAQSNTLSRIKRCANRCVLQKCPEILCFPQNSNQYVHHKMIYNCIRQILLDNNVTSIRVPKPYNLTKISIQTLKEDFDRLFFVIGALLIDLVDLRVCGVESKYMLVILKKLNNFFRYLYHYKIHKNTKSYFQLLNEYKIFVFILQRFVYTEIFSDLNVIQGLDPKIMHFYSKNNGIENKTLKKYIENQLKNSDSKKNSIEIKTLLNNLKEILKNVKDDASKYSESELKEKYGRNIINAIAYVDKYTCLKYIKIPEIKYKSPISHVRGFYHNRELHISNDGVNISNEKSESNSMSSRNAKSSRSVSIDTNSYKIGEFYEDISDERSENNSMSSRNAKSSRSVSIDPNSYKIGEFYEDISDERSENNSISSKNTKSSRSVSTNPNSYNLGEFYEDSIDSEDIVFGDSASKVSEWDLRQINAQVLTSESNVSEFDLSQINAQVPTSELNVSEFDLSQIHHQVLTSEFNASELDLSQINAQVPTSELNVSEFDLSQIHHQVLTSEFNASELDLSEIHHQVLTSESNASELDLSQIDHKVPTFESNASELDLSEMNPQVLTSELNASKFNLRKKKPQILTLESNASKFNLRKKKPQILTLESNASELDLSQIDHKVPTFESNASELDLSEMNPQVLTPELNASELNLRKKKPQVQKFLNKKQSTHDYLNENRKKQNKNSINYSHEDKFESESIDNDGYLQNKPFDMPLSTQTRTLHILHDPGLLKDLNLNDQYKDAFKGIYDPKNHSESTICHENINPFQICELLKINKPSPIHDAVSKILEKIFRTFHEKYLEINLDLKPKFIHYADGSLNLGINRKFDAQCYVSKKYTELVFNNKSIFIFVRLAPFNSSLLVIYQYKNSKEIKEGCFEAIFKKQSPNCILNLMKLKTDPGYSETMKKSCCHRVLLETVPYDIQNTWDTFEPLIKFPELKNGQRANSHVEIVKTRNKIQVQDKEICKDCKSYNCRCKSSLEEFLKIQAEKDKQSEIEKKFTEEMFASKNQEFENKKSSLQNEISNLNAEIEKYKLEGAEIIELKNKINNLIFQKQNCETVFEIKKAEHNEQKKNLENKIGELNGIRERFKKLEQEKAELEGKLENLGSQLLDLENKMKAGQNEAEKKSEEKNKSHEKEIKTLETQINDLNSNNKKITKILEQKQFLELEIEDLKKFQGAREEMWAVTLSEHEEKVKSLQVEITTLTLKRETLQKENDEKENRHASEKRSLEDKIRELNEKIVMCENNKQEIIKLESEIYHEKTQVFELEGLRDKLVNTIQSLENELKNEKKSLADEQKENEGLRNILQKERELIEAEKNAFKLEEISQQNKIQLLEKQNENLEKKSNQDQEEFDLFKESKNKEINDILNMQIEKINAEKERNYQLENTINSLKKRLEEKNRNLEILQSQIIEEETLKKEKENQIQELFDRIFNFEKINDENSESLQKLETQKKDLELELKRMKDKINDLQQNALKQNLEEIENLKDEISKLNKELIDKDRLKSEIFAKDALLQNKEIEIKCKIDEIEELKKKQTDLQENIKTKLSEIDEKNTALKDKTAKIEEMASEIKVNSQIIEGLKNQNKDLDRKCEKQENDLKTKSNEISNNEKCISVLKNEKLNLKAQINDANTKFLECEKTLENKIKNLEKELDTKNEEVKKMSEFENQVDQLNEQLRDQKIRLNKEIHTLNEKLKKQEEKRAENSQQKPQDNSLIDQNTISAREIQGNSYSSSKYLKIVFKGEDLLDLTKMRQDSYQNNQAYYLLSYNTKETIKTFVLKILAQKKLSDSIESKLIHKKTQMFWNLLIQNKNDEKNKLFLLDYFLRELTGDKKEDEIHEHLIKTFFDEADTEILIKNLACCKKYGATKKISYVENLQVNHSLKKTFVDFLLKHYSCERCGLVGLIGDYLQTCPQILVFRITSMNYKYPKYLEIKGSTYIILDIEDNKIEEDDDGYLETEDGMFGEYIVYRKSQMQ